MRKFKTAEDNRTNYIYYFNDGTSYTITPGENGENATIIEASGMIVGKKTISNRI